MEPTELVDRVFGANADKARRYHRWLADEATVRGLIGPRETPKLWDRHIINSAVVGEAIGRDLVVADIGSGAGLPGIPLALARPDLTVYLVEPLLRRTTFLSEVIDDLGLSNVIVVRGRAEDKEVLDKVAGVDVVTSRAVAPLGKLSRWSLPLVRSGGVMVALKGGSAPEEIERDGKIIAKAKGLNPRVVEVGGTVLETPTFVVIIKKK
nr:16S rRNA (guanine(527)-N(7))-methyltransferase RsmG [Corynebacterium lactis]